jgi:putative ABC transport system permease protein
LFLRLAWRNVFRQRPRTAVALSAIAAGCAALIVNGGVIYNIFRELREDAIRGRHGHLQIYRRGYSAGHRAEPGRYLMPTDVAERVLQLVRAHPGVDRATRRREMTGMISRGDRYVAFVGVGVEPEHDAEFSRHLTLRTGVPLSSAEPYGIHAGRGLAEKFAGSPGALVTVMTNTEDGALNAVDARLIGIFEGGLKEYDDWTLKLPIGAVDDLLLDDRTEQIVLLLDRTEDVPRVRAGLEAVFRREGLDLETRSWDELALFHNQVVSLFRRELDVIKLIIATIVVLGIGNTIGMSVLERRVELATLRAVGLRPRAIGALLYAEAAMLGLIGGALGVVGGIAIARVVTAIGIPFPSPPGSTRPFTGGVDVVSGVVAFAFGLSVLATLAAAALPIWRAMRRPIAETLRQA